MRRALAIALACVLLTGGAALAQTAAEELDASPPPDDARAGMCDAFDGLAFTFCVALCEARDCDTRDVDDGRCALLRHGFALASAGATVPCPDPSPAGLAL